MTALTSQRSSGPITRERVRDRWPRLHEESAGSVELSSVNDPRDIILLGVELTCVFDDLIALCIIGCKGVLTMDTSR